MAVIDFKSGQGITVIIYRGTSKAEANTTMEFLEKHFKNNIPIPLRSSEMLLNIT